VSEIFTSCPLSTADHNTVLFRINAPAYESVSEPEFYYDFIHADYSNLNAYFSDVNWNYVFQSCFYAEQCWGAFMHIVNTAIELFVPQRKSNQNRAKNCSVNYPRYIKKMIKKKAVLWKRWKISCLPKDKVVYHDMAVRCRSAVNKFNAAKELELIRKNNLGSFYNFVNRKVHPKRFECALKREDGSMTDDCGEKAHIFNNFFATVFTQDNGCTPELPRRVGVDTCLTSVTFTPTIVRRTICKLKPTLSSGVDGISNFFLKNCADSLCLPLCHIFDTSFKNKEIPEQWRTAIIVPIHKKGVTSDPNNYRPISLTSTSCRVMERVINNEILDYLLRNNIISKHQHGFIKKKSTCTNLLECLNDWSFNMQAKTVNDIIYFDFKKAFDSVSHSKLLTKLRAYGISGDLFDWIEAFLSNRKQAVTICNTLSFFIPVISGVPQGSVLGPTLFLLFINDVTDIFDGLSVTCKLYADDIKLYTSYCFNQLHSNLVDATERLIAWADNWQLKLAADKCIVCRLKQSQWPISWDASNTEYKINDSTLQ